MPTYGLSTTGFLKKPLTVIKSEVEAALIAKFGEINTEAESTFGILIGILSDREYQLWELQEETYLSMYPNSAEGFSLDGVSQMTGIIRLAATRTLVTAALLGDEGTSVIAGKQASVDGTGEVFSLIQDAEITKDGVIRCVSTPTDGLTGATYEVEIDGTTYTITPGGSPTQTQVVTAMIADLVTTTIQFDVDFVASNSIVATVDGVALSAVPFNADHNTTIDDLATAIQALSTVTSATVSGGDNRLLTVVGASGISFATIDSIVTTGGASQPVGTIEQASRSGLLFTTANGGDSLVIASDDFETTFQFDDVTNWSIDTIESPGFFQADNTGIVIALTGTLISIETPVSGWTSVINYQDGSVGRAIETDAELRLRRKQSFALIGAGTVEAIRANLLQDVDDVIGVKITENRTDTTDGDGRPPHSFETVISGGSDIDVAEKIWELKPAGIETFGTTSQNITDSQGDTQAIKFSRPTDQLLYVRITLTKNTEETYPAGGDAQIAANVLAYAQTLGIGDDVLVQRFLPPVFEVSGVKSAVVEVDLTAGAPAYGTSDIAVAADEIAVPDSTRITIV